MLRLSLRKLLLLVALCCYFFSTVKIEKSYIECNNPRGEPYSKAHMLFVDFLGDFTLTLEAYEIEQKYRTKTLTLQSHFARRILVVLLSNNEWFPSVEIRQVYRV